MPPSGGGGSSTAKAPQNHSMRRGVPPPAPQTSGAITPLAVPRSEFEDFMNAYRPNLDVPRREPEPKAHYHQEETSKVDFGRSIKKLMKRPQSSPRNARKEGGIQRTPTAHPERERSVASDIRPPVEKKGPPLPKRPLSAHLEGGMATPPIPMAPLDASPPPAPPPRGIVKGPAEESPKVLLESPPVLAVPFPAPVQVQVQVQVPNPVQPKKKVSLPPPATLEALRRASETLSYVEGHCLIISSNNIARFLPPRHNPDPLLSMRVVPIPERKYHVIMEFEESPEPPAPRTSTSGLVVVGPDQDMAPTSRHQRESFAWIRESRVAASGMLLRNVERITEFPYVTFLVVGGGRHELNQKLIHVRDRPIPIPQQQLHFLAGYEEAVTVSRPPPTTFPEPPCSDKTGFVISLYQVLPGEDGLRFEQNWVMWTGARQLYRNVPEYMGLKKISVHKSVLPTQVINYALICEFSNIMDYLTEACVLIDHLRARCCGFIGVYRVLEAL